MRCRAKVRLESTFGAHGSIRRMLFAASAFGLTATHAHDGGWWVRQHLVRLAGPEAAMKRFAHWYESWEVA